MIKLLITALVLLWVQDAAAIRIVFQTTPNGDRYGFLPTAKPGPLALVLATDIAESLSERFTTVGSRLSAAGYVVAAVDMPCHGMDVRPSDLATAPPVIDGLGCWASRVSRDGGDIFEPVILRVGRVIADLQARGVTVGQRVIAVGVSRGGYVAMRAAIAHPSITDLVVFSPVTDLQRLKEFAAIRVNKAVYGLDRGFATLSRRRMFLQIGSNDDRVGTREALHVVDGIVEAGGSAAIDLTVVVVPVPGHATAEHDRALAWVLSRRSMDSFGVAPPK